MVGGDCCWWSFILWTLYTNLIARMKCGHVILLPAFYPCGPRTSEAGLKSCCIVWSSAQQETRLTA